MAAPNEQDQKAEPGTDSAAVEVIAEAIDAMRDDRAARHAADAIQQAWSGQKLDVDRAIEGIGIPVGDDAKDDT